MFSEQFLRLLLIFFMNHEAKAILNSVKEVATRELRYFSFTYF